MSSERNGSLSWREDGDDHFDADLLRRIRAGNVAALESLIQHLWEPLLRYAASITPETVDPQDVVQDAFVRLWVKRSELDASGDLTALLYRITRNLALNAKRRRKVRASWMVSCDPAYDAPIKATPLEWTEEGELRRAAGEAVERLSPRRREVFILSRFHGRTYREIAGIMGISEQTVANHLSAALASLREALRPYLERRESGEE